MKSPTTLPDDWEVRPLREVAEIQTGFSKGGKATGKMIEVPYLRVANVQEGYLNLSEIKTVSLPVAKLERYRLRKGDLLLTEGGDFDKLGRGALWQGQLNPCVHQNHVFVVRANEEVLDRRFLALLTGSEYGKRYFRSCSKQSTNLASINSSQLKAFPTLLPPIKDQIRIADMLGSWNRAIERLDELIQRKEEMFTEVTKRLVTGKGNRSNSDTEWRTVYFGNLMKESRIPGGTGEASKKITIKLYGRGVVGKSETRQGSSNTQYYKRKSGQFIYSKLDFLNGAFGIVPQELDGFESTLDLPAFDLSSEVHHEWLLSYVTRPEFYERCVGYASGGRKARRVNPKSFAKISLLLPPLNYQQTVVNQLSAMRSELEKLEALREARKRQKHTVLSKILNGGLKI